MVIQGILALLVFGLLACALLGAMRSFSGKPFKYIILGRLFEKVLLDEDHMDVLPSHFLESTLSFQSDGYTVANEYH
jgi:hypothetical protein